MRITTHVIRYRIPRHQVKVISFPREMKKKLPIEIRTEHLLAAKEWKQGTKGKQLCSPKIRIHHQRAKKYLKMSPSPA